MVLGGICDKCYRRFDRNSRHVKVCPDCREKARKGRMPNYKRVLNDSYYIDALEKLGEKLKTWKAI